MTAGPRTWRQDSPFGSLLVATGPAGVFWIGLANAHEVPAAAIPPALQDRTVREGRPSATVARWLDGFFAGARRPNCRHVDLSAVAGFDHLALETLWRSVGWGDLVSYGELAELAGRPGAARAVGRAMARNPVPFLVPCHRVVASNGLGGYGSGGLAMKRRLLGLEGTVVTTKRATRSTRSTR